MDFILDLFLTACGLYFAYCGYDMKKTGEIKTGVMVSKNVVIRKDADKAGYINYMYPKTIVIGILTAICGLVGLANDYFGGMGMIFLAMVVVFFITMVIYGIFVSKAQKKYLQ